MQAIDRHVLEAGLALEPQFFHASRRKQGHVVGYAHNYVVAKLEEPGVDLACELCDATNGAYGGTCAIPTGYLIDCVTHGLHATTSAFQWVALAQPYSVLVNCSETTTFERVAPFASNFRAMTITTVFTGFPVRARHGEGVFVRCVHTVRRFQESYAQAGWRRSVVSNVGVAVDDVSAGKRLRTIDGAIARWLGVCEKPDATEKPAGDLHLICNISQRRWRLQHLIDPGEQKPAIWSPCLGRLSWQVE